VSRRTRLLVRACVCTALGDEEGLRRELRRARPGDQRDLREAILQTYLFAGFPRAINGLWVLNETLGPAEPWREARRDAFARRGESLCRRIYGRDYEAMMRNMRRLHPDLAEWILLEGYGKTLSRAYFDAKTRELLIVPVLVALGAWRQLPSHVKGTLRVGGTTRELLAALDAARGLIAAKALARARLAVSNV
jgi:4-carboxymuconolactone decarboxylase